MEDIVVIQSQDYAQILFEDLNECYAESQDLECVFTLNELVKIDTSDWIGIYKVGFNNCKDHICKQQIEMDKVKDSKGSIVFTADQVPKDDGEFYQFVYVSQQSQIRGASIPFQFKKTYLSDYIQIEDQEAVVFKSKESALNETLSEMKQKCEHLSATNQSYVKLIKENEEIITCLKDELSSVKLRCLKFTMDNESLTHSIKLKSECFKNLQDQMSVVLKENANIQAKYDALSSGQISSLEGQIKEQADELSKLKDQIKHNEHVIIEQQTTMRAIIGEKYALSETVKLIMQQKSEMESNYHNTLHELQMCKDKLAADEQCKEMLRSQLTVVGNELAECKNLNGDLNKQVEVANGKLEQAESQLSDLGGRYESLKGTYETKLVESNGSYFALKLAHSHLETKLRQQEKDADKLRQENEELKDRIKVGAKEYSKLVDKYREVKSNKSYDLMFNENYTKRRDSFMTDSSIQTNVLPSNNIDSELIEAFLNNSVKESDDGLNHEGGASASNDFQIKQCDMCSYQFPTGSKLQDIENHYNEQHYGPACPVCFLSFDKGFPQSEFEKHVNGHFSN